MSQLYLIADNIDGDVYYTVLSYRFMSGSCGYFYQIIVRKVGATVSQTMIVRDGILYDYLENMRKNNIAKRFKFKKSNIALSESVNNDYIIIAGYNELITLNDI